MKTWWLKYKEYVTVFFVTYGAVSFLDDYITLIWRQFQ